jgi:hypothetical protein
MRCDGLLLAALLPWSAAVACSDEDQEPASSTTENAAGGGATGGAVGAGGEGSIGCKGEPFTCPTGQTCWYVDYEKQVFECRPAGAGRKGSDCEQSPEPTCGDALICIGVSADASACVPFCDPAHPCVEPEACVETTGADGTVLFHVCAPGA